MSMDENHGPHAGPPPLQPDMNQIRKEDVLTQFAVIRMKDDRVVVQFPVLNSTTQEVDAPEAMELVAAGLQTLARIVRQQQQKEPSRIALVPAMPGLKAD